MHYEMTQTRMFEITIGIKVDGFSTYIVSLYIIDAL